MSEVTVVRLKLHTSALRCSAIGTAEIVVHRSAAVIMRCQLAPGIAKSRGAPRRNMLNLTALRQSVPHRLTPKCRVRHRRQCTRLSISHLSMTLAQANATVMKVGATNGLTTNLRIARSPGPDEPRRRGAAEARSRGREKPRT